jgi:hypothetical protein
MKLGFMLIRHLGMHHPPHPLFVTFVVVVNFDADGRDGPPFCSWVSGTNDNEGAPSLRFLQGWGAVKSILVPGSAEGVSELD